MKNICLATASINLCTSEINSTDQEWALIVTTNGNPVFLGSYNSKGFNYLLGDVQEDEELEEYEIPEWMFWLLQFGFKGKTSKDAFEFLKTLPFFPFN